MDFSLCTKITENISQVIVGKHQAIELLLVGLLAEGRDAPARDSGADRALGVRVVAAGRAKL